MRQERSQQHFMTAGAYLIATLFILCLAFAQPLPAQANQSVQGTVTDGVNPIANITVEIWSTAGPALTGTVVTDGAGGFCYGPGCGGGGSSLNGTYKIYINAWTPGGGPPPGNGPNYLPEFYNNKFSFATANVPAFNGAGGITTLAAITLEQGGIVGNALLSGLTVALYDAFSGEIATTTTTDAFGTYQLRNLPLDGSTYKVYFDPKDYNVANGTYYEGRWYNGTDWTTADPLTISGATPVHFDVNAALILGAGRITGKVTDYCTSNMKDVMVLAFPSAATDTSNPTAIEWTDTAGNFSFYLWPGSYTLYFVPWLYNDINGQDFLGEFYNNSDTLGGATAVNSVAGAVRWANAQLNRPPLVSVPNQSVYVNEPLSFYLSGQDADCEQTLGYWSGSLPTGATLDSTSGQFQWTPDCTQIGDTVVSFETYDSGSVQGITTTVMTITVSNRAPILNAIGDKSVYHGDKLEFSVSAWDRDPDADLVYSAVGSLAGQFDPATKVFSWTPGCAGNVGTYTLVFQVTDCGGTGLTTSEQINIVVKNRPPTIDTISPPTVYIGDTLTFVVAGHDLDTDDTALVYAMAAGPAGASFTGQQFSWTPGCSDVGTAVATFQVGDCNSETATVSVIITVVNRPPVLAKIGNKTANYNVTLQIPLSATDGDTGDTLTYSVQSSPALSPAATIDADHIFRWKPDCAAVTTNTFVVTFTVTDSCGATGTEVVTIHAQNRPPVLTPIGDKIVYVGDTLLFTAYATDPDTNDTLTWSALSPSAALQAAFNTGTQKFSWTPGCGDVGTYSLTITVKDFCGVESDSETINVTVVNRPPVINTIGDKTVYIGDTLQFGVSAVDGDTGDVLTYSAASSNAAVQAGFTAATKRFSWTPACADVGSQTITFTATDACGATDTEVVTISIVNRPPVINTIGDKTVYVGDTLTFAASAVDGDTGDVLVWSKSASNAAVLAAFDVATRRFSWTPTCADVGTQTLVLTVTDSCTATDSETVTITIVNRPPVLDTIGNKTAHYNTLLQFQLQAVDGDTGDSLTFSAQGLPTGATLTNGLFKWKPDCDQVATNTFVVTFSVTDSCSATDTEVVTIHAINRPPVMAAIGDKIVYVGDTLLFTATATDADANDPLTWSAVSPNAALQAAFDAATQKFSWTPGCPDVGTYSLTITATDFCGVQSDSETINVTVVNRPPVINTIGDKTVYVGDNLNFAVSAVDGDTGDVLTYAGASTNAAVQAAFNATTKRFSWTPACADVGSQTITFTVTDACGATDTEVVTISIVNRPPVINTIGDKTVYVGDNLNFAVSAVDGDTGDVLTYAGASTNAAVQAAFNATTKRFSWTPACADVGSQTITFTVTDACGATDTEVVTISIVNRPPVINTIGDKTVYVGDNLNFAVSAVDGDTGDVLTYAGASTNAAVQAAFNATTKRFSWTPACADVGSQTITFTVTDACGATDTEVVTISIVNRPPVINTIGDKTVYVGDNLNFAVSAVDGDTGDVLTWAGASTNAAVQAAFNATTKRFSWTPACADVGSQTITFTVTDACGATDTEVVTISIVNRPPVLNAIASRAVYHGDPVHFTASAVDGDTGDVLTFSAAGDLAAYFDPATKTFTWTPACNQTGSTFTLVVTVTDSCNATDSALVAFTVVDRPPIIDTIGPKTVYHGDTINFPVSANDLDTDEGVLAYSATGTLSGYFNTGTRVFSWTPTCANVGTHTVVFEVRDCAGQVSTEQVLITVLDRPPVLDAIGPQTVYINQILRFTASANDLDTDDQLTYSATGSLAAYFNTATRVFSWTPGCGDVGTRTLTIRVTDCNGQSSSEIVTIQVLDHPPTVDKVGNQWVHYGDTLTFFVGADDLDTGDHPTVGVQGLPAGATFLNGQFTWTPDCDDAAVGTFALTFTATDCAGVTGTEAMVITVTNRPPVLNAIGAHSIYYGDTLRFAISGYDFDNNPGLVYSAQGLPAGAAFDPVTQTFTWKPDCEDTGTHLVTFAITDCGNARDQEVVAITVEDRAPVLNPIGDRTVHYGDALQFSTSAYDLDTGSTLSYFVEGLPAGASYTDGVFSWIPNCDDARTGTFVLTFTVSDCGNMTASETITITVTNWAPVIQLIEPVEVYHHELIQFPVHAYDFEENSALTYTVQGLPPEAVLDPATGLFTWIPDCSDAVVGSYVATFFIADCAGAIDSQVVTFTILDHPPVLDPIAPQEVEVLDDLTFTVTATDEDLPNDTLTFSLVDPPAGATIDPSSGVFEWTPALGQEGTHTVTVQVTDCAGVSATVTVSIHVEPAEIFRDDFSHGLGDWIITQGNFRLNKERLASVYNTPAPSSKAIVAPGHVPLTIDAGRIGVDIKLTSLGSALPNAYVLFGYQDRLNYRYVKFTKGKITVAMITLGTETKVSFSVPIPVGTKFNTWVDVYADGLVRVYVNGVLRAEKKYALLNTGNVGLKAGRTRTFFDNFVIYDPDVLP